MGGAISSTISLGLTYCCASAVGKVCEACLGTTAPGTTGRKRGVLLLSIAIALSLWMQYTVGPSIVTQKGWIWKTYRVIPGTGKLVYSAFYNPCQQYDPKNEDGSTRLLEQCAGNQGVYRPMALTFLFFTIHAMATRLVPTLNREVWPAKYIVCMFAMLLFMILPGEFFLDTLFLWTARFGAAIFLMLQQVILIDVAYNWNEDWVERANEADRIQYGAGTGWLRAIVITCVLLYSLTLLGIVLLFQYFHDCPGNVWVLTLTLIGILAMTGIQLSGTEGSLLTSSVLSLYVVYLAFQIVSKNPQGRCNPRLGEDDTWGVVMGLGLTALSLAWTGWAWSAEPRLSIQGSQTPKSMMVPHNTSSTGGGSINLDVPFLDPDDQPTSGIVTETDGTAAAASGEGVSSDVWKLNVVMALISCWVAMLLTGWGTVDGMDEEQRNAANPIVGRVNMAMMGLSQWLAISLYIWTLLAPRIYPDYDFS